MAQIEDNYLKRLQNIRQKYNHSHQYQCQQIRNRPIQSKSQHSHSTINKRQKFTNYAIEGHLGNGTKTRGNIQKQSETVNYGKMRCQSFQRNSILKTDQDQNAFRFTSLQEAHIKKQDNFNTFMLELQAKKYEKSYLQSQKGAFFTDQAQRNHTECPEYQQIRQLNNYSSSKKIEVALRQNPILNHFPRTAYEKSLSYRNSRFNPYGNVENVVPQISKWKPPLSLNNCNLTNTRKKQMSVQNTKSRRVDSNSNKLQLKPQRQGWDPTHLDNIQLRIKSALKQMNN